MTLEDLKAMLPRLASNPNTAAALYPHLIAAMNEGSINTPLRIAAFLAQVGHESLDLTIWQENLNYSAEGLMKTWPKRFDATKAAACARKPEKIANTVYANRLGNGDEASGDGWKYRGKGPIQLTGKANHKIYGDELGVDLVVNPEKLLTPAVGCRAAVLYWKKNDLNALADAKNIKEITKRINGGFVGLEDRVARYDAILKILGA